MSLVSLQHLQDSVRARIFLMLSIFLQLMLKILFLIITEVPSIPVIKNKETEMPRCGVILTWSPPADNGCPLTMYTINYQRIQPREIGEPWYQINLTDIMTTNLTMSLSCGTQYTIEISAWNEVGESDRSRPWIIKTLSQSGTFSSISSYNVSLSEENCREEPGDQTRQAEKKRERVELAVWYGTSVDQKIVFTGEFFGKKLIPRYPLTQTLFQLVTQSYPTELVTQSSFPT